MAVKCCLNLRKGAISIGSFFLIIAIIQFIISVVFININNPVRESESSDSPKEDFQKWLVEEYKKFITKNKISNGNGKFPEDNLTGTVEAEITAWIRFAKLVSERFRIALLVISIINILSNLALIYGAVKRNGNFVSLWLWLQMVIYLVSLLCCALLTLIFCSAELYSFGAALVALFLILSSIFGYCYAKVYKFYHELYIFSPSTQVDSKNAAKFGYELKNFTPEAEYI